MCIRYIAIFKQIRPNSIFGPFDVSQKESLLLLFMLNLYMFSVEREPCVLESAEVMHDEGYWRLFGWRLTEFT